MDFSCHFLWSVHWRYSRREQPHLTLTFFQRVVESNELPISLLRTKQTQLPQPYPLRQVFYAFHEPCCPCLDTLKHLRALFKASSSKQLPAGLSSIHHNALGPAIRAVFYSSKTSPIPAESRWFFQEERLKLNFLLISNLC